MEIEQQQPIDNNQEQQEYLIQQQNQQNQLLLNQFQNNVTINQKQTVQKLKQQQIDDLKWQVFDLLRTIKDPEFPQTLEQLKVIQEENIEYEEIQGIQLIRIIWVPTVPNCHLANQIGLSIMTKLQNELLDFDTYKIQILVKEGTHQDKEMLDKQINDKERIAAAQENETLMSFINTLVNYGIEQY